MTKNIGFFASMSLTVARVLIFVLAIFSAVAMPFESVMAGVIGKENRQSIEKYAQASKVDIQEIRGRYGATGRIMCPFREASAFIIYKPNIVATARHNLFPEKEMNSYAGKSDILRCSFELTDGETSTWYKVDVNSFVYPEENQRSVADRFDWVVMRLTAPISGVTPYRLPTNPALKGDSVTTSTIRQDGFREDGWNARILGDCKIRNVVAIDKIAGSGIFTDCSSAPGASGGALLKQTEYGLEAVGIMSSTTLTNCKKYKMKSCSSYAVGISNEVVQAIKELADQ